MYDSVDAGAIPPSAVLVGGYVDGRYAWSKTDWLRFPAAVQVRIAVFPSTDDGNCADVEASDMTPQSVVGWVQRRRAAGVDPSVYCSANSWDAVRTAFAAAVEAEPHYWIADWNGLQTVPAGAVAHQYASQPGYDLSAVADYWPGVDPMTTPTPTPTPTDPLFGVAVRAIIDQYLAVELNQGTSAQALIQALLHRLQGASDALNLKL